MKIYFIKISGVPKERVHAALRTYHWEEHDAYTLFLTVNGRLTDSVTKRANIDSYKLIENFYSYWLPRLKGRKYGEIKVEINSETANKWQEKRVHETCEKITNLLEKGVGKNIPSKVQKQDGNLIVKLYYTSNDGASKTGYLVAYKNDGSLEVGSHITSARRYKSMTYCDKLIIKLEKNINYKAKIKLLTSEEINKIESEKAELRELIFSHH